jgi:hypothetical protein
MGRTGTPGVWPCLLMTRRSQVQILPPLLALQIRGPFPLGEALSHVRTVTRSVTKSVTSDVSVVPLRLRRSADFEIRGTYCDASGHLRRGRRVETQRSHLDSWQTGQLKCRHPVGDKIGADGARALSSSSVAASRSSGGDGQLAGQALSTRLTRAFSSSRRVAATVVRSASGGRGTVMTTTLPPPGRGIARMYAPPSRPGAISRR